MSADLYPAAITVAAKLRQAGQSVDLVLEDKKPKWAFKHADRIGAKFLCNCSPRRSLREERYP
jgi:histidyl-tRNA synthetase